MANILEIIIEGKDKYSSAFKDVNNTLDSHGSAVKSVTAFVSGLGLAYAGIKMVDFIQGQIDAADSMGKAAQKAGVSVEALGELQYAASLSDVAAGELDVALRFLNTSLSNTRDGTSKQAELFKSLGIATTDASGKLRGADDVMQDIADRFATMGNGAEKTAMAVELFGRSGTAMIPMLNGGSAGLAAMAEEARRAGVVFTEETAKGAEEFNDSMTRMKANMTGIANTVLPAMVRGLNSLMEAFGLATAEEGNRTHQLAVELEKLNIQYKSRYLNLKNVEAAAAGGNQNAIKALGSYRSAADQTLNKIKELEAQIGKLNSASEVMPISDLATEKKPAAAKKDVYRGTGKDDFVKSLYEDTRTPQEQFIARMERIGGLYKSNAINLELYNRAASMYVEETLKGAQATEQTAEAFGEANADNAYAMLDAVTNVFQQSGAMADAYYTQQLADINNMVAEYQAMGMSQVDLEIFKTQQIIDLNEQMYETLRNMELARLDAQLEDSESFTEIFTLTMEMMALTAETYGQQVSGSVREMFNGLSEGIGNTVAQTLLYGKNAAEMFKALAKQVLAQMIGNLVTIGVQRMILGQFEAKAATAAAYGNTFASIAAIPIVGPALAPGAAATAAATVRGTMGGILAAAHGGMDYVPGEGTYLLDRGERVLSPKQNQDLTNFLSGDGGAGGVAIDNLTIHILENATSADALMSASPAEMQALVAEKVIPALNALNRRGMKLEA